MRHLHEDANRDASKICVVEHVPDLIAIERSSAWKARHHVLHGKLSPIHGVDPKLNLKSLQARIKTGEVTELVLALSNDIEGRQLVISFKKSWLRIGRLKSLVLALAYPAVAV